LVSNANPVLRNALRFSISAREEELLAKYLKSRKAHHAATPSSPPAEKAEGGNAEENYSIATTRVTGRLFISSYAVLKVWELLMDRFKRRTIQ